MTDPLSLSCMRPTLFSLFYPSRRLPSLSFLSSAVIIWMRVVTSFDGRSSSEWAGYGSKKETAHSTPFIHSVQSVLLFLIRVLYSIEYCIIQYFIQYSLINSSLLLFHDLNILSIHSFLPFSSFFALFHQHVLQLLSLPILQSYRSLFSVSISIPYVPFPLTILILSSFNHYLMELIET